MPRQDTPNNLGFEPLEFGRHEDTFQDFERLLGFPCEGLIRAWEWQDRKEEGIITEAFLGKSKSFLEAITVAKKTRGISAPILITGESGTGKELLAHFIHQMEGKPERPFVAVNCGAIPDNLMESELFGHEKGAFTGAIDRKIGFFEKANGGDIFLDEIGVLKPELQVKLLRVLQDQKIHRIGGKKPIQLNFRVIAATNENLHDLVEQGSFRIDLYYRLSVVPIHMPPLRERKEDISLLIDYFVHRYGSPDRKISLTSEALDFLKKYSWPGNVRELENLIQRLTVFSAGKIISEKELVDALHRKEVRQSITDSQSEEALKNSLGKSEKEIIRNVLEQYSWNYSAVARKLKISRTTLYRKIKLHNLSKSGTPI